MMQRLEYRLRLSILYFADAEGRALICLLMRESAIVMAVSLTSLLVRAWMRGFRNFASCERFMRFR